MLCYAPSHVKRPTPCFNECIATKMKAKNCAKQTLLTLVVRKTKQYIAD